MGKKEQQKDEKVKKERTSKVKNEQKTMSKRKTNESRMNKIEWKNGNIRIKDKTNFIHLDSALPSTEHN